MAANKRLISRHSQGRRKLNYKAALLLPFLMKSHMLARMKTVWNSSLLVGRKKEQLLCAVEQSFKIFKCHIPIQFLSISPRQTKTYGHMRTCVHIFLGRLVSSEEH